MNNTIKCPKCGEKIQIDKILSHQIEEEVLVASQAKHEQELAQVKKEAQEQIEQKLIKDFQLQLKSLQKERDEEKDRNSRLLKQLEDLTDQIRQLRRKDEERELEMKKRLSEEEGKIKEETAKKYQEEHELKDREKDKLINDLKKDLEQTRRRAEQGSQQTQGEVLELELEEILKKEFSLDNIKEVKKGQRGADIVQEVVDKLGRKCGLILWESKNAQWTDGWIAKLKEDQRQAKAHLGILVVSNPPPEIKTFIYKDGVWITTRKTAVPLALALRFNLVSLNYEKLANVGKNEKMEVLYQYITSIEFKQRIEAIVEAFGNLQGEMEREKRWFMTKWAREEKQLRKVIDHTQGMYGDLQGVVGKSLPDIKSLELEAGK